MASIPNSRLSCYLNVDILYSQFAYLMLIALSQHVFLIHDYHPIYTYVVLILNSTCSCNLRSGHSQYAIFMISACR